MTRPAGDVPPRPWAAVLTTALLVAAVLLVFFPALQADFVNLDDDRTVLAPREHSGFAPAQLLWMATSFETGHWHPLTWFSFAVDRALWGDGPFGFHLGNVLLHALAAALWLAVARQVLTEALRRRAQRTGTAAPPAATMELAALFAAVLFALHPLRVESVAWISERRDVLSGALFLGALLAWLSLRRLPEGAPGEGRRFALFVVLLVLSLLSKAWGAALPVVLVALELWPFEREVLRPAAQTLRRRLLAALGTCLPLSFAALVVAAGAQQASGATRAWEQHGLLERLVQSAYGLVFYPLRTLWPTGLSPLYPLEERLDPTEARFVFAALAVVAACAAAAVQWRRRPWWSAALLAYIAIVAPVLGLLQSGPQLVADRYSYLSMLPFALLAGGGALALARVAERRVRRRGQAVSAAVLVVLLVAVAWPLGLASHARCAVWRSSETLWTSALEVIPDSYFARHGLGRALLESGRDAEAVLHFEHALRHQPSDREGRATIRQSLGAALGNLGRLDEAREHWLEVLRLDPGHLHVLQDLAVAAALQQRFDEAREWTGRVLQAAAGAPPDAATEALVQRARALRDSLPPPGGDPDPGGADG